MRCEDYHRAEGVLSNGISSQTPCEGSRNPAPTRTRAGFSFWQMMRRLPEPNAACIIEWVFDNPDEPLIVCHASPQQQTQFEWTRAGAHGPVMALLGHRKSAGSTPAFEQCGH